MIAHTLDQARSEAAEAEFETFVFDEEAELVAADGWERTLPGDEWSRKLYFTPIDGEGDSVAGHFTIVFETDTANIFTAYASIDGNDVGHRGAIGVMFP